MPFKTDSVRGEFAAASIGGVPGALSRGKESPGQGQRPPFPSKRHAEDTLRTVASMPATPWRTPELLLPRRTNYFDCTTTGKLKPGAFRRPFPLEVRFREQVAYAELNFMCQLGVTLWPAFPVALGQQRDY